MYESQLRDAGAVHVVHFDIYDGNRLVYSIFFATKHHVGCDRMKAAIWKVAPDGGFELRGTHSDQFTLTLEPNLEPLKRQLLDAFGDGNWSPIDAPIRLVQSDKTDFHSGQLKKATLVPMEKNGLISSNSDPI